MQTGKLMGSLGLLFAATIGLAACGVGLAAPPTTPPIASPSTPPPSPVGVPRAVEGAVPPTSVVPGRTVTIVGNGDFLIHNTLWMQAQADGRNGQMDFSPQIAAVKKRTSDADFAICHQETTFARPGGPFTGYPVFSTPPQLVRAIKGAGYDACSTVSNHTLDGGMDGISRTLDALDAAGIGHSGSARTPTEASTPAIYQVNGVAVAHLAYAYGFNGYKAPAGTEWCCNLIDPEKMITDAKAAREAGAQLVIVSMHAGDENIATPNVQQRTVAAALAASGQVDLVLGHHVHVVQPVEKIGNMWVAYGLGNLLSGQYDSWKRNKEGVIASFTFTQTPDGKFEVTRAAGYPTLNTAGPIRVSDLVRDLPKSGGDARALEAYQQTRKTLLSMGAAADGFVVPAPGSGQ